MTLKFAPGDQSDAFGDHFIIGLSGPKLSRQDKENLKKLRPLGIMLLARNFLTGKEGVALPYDQWLAALRQLLSEVHKYAEREKMIISIDHEGGRVHRTPEPIARFPAAQKYARRCREVADVISTQLESIGVNVLFGPCADIHSNPNNPVIGVRSFGSDPESVASCVVEFTERVIRSRVLPCVKHFPGHGDTEKDSHHELPTLNLSREQLTQRELIPFKAAIAAGVPMIMSAHILFPQIDVQRPATLSAAIMRTILREQLGFNGVVVTDDLDMKAVAHRMALPEGIGGVFHAGGDLCIVSSFHDSDSDRPQRIAKALSTALRERYLAESEIHESHQRVAALYQRVQLNSVTALPLNLLAEQRQLADEITRE